MAERKLTPSSPEVSPSNPHQEVFTPKKANHEWTREIWETIAEVIKRFSHQQYEYMPREITVGELVKVILDQNEHLRVDNEGIIDMKGNHKQYLVGLSDGSLESRVTALLPDDLSIQIGREKGNEIASEVLTKNQKIRFTMTPGEPAPSQTS